MLGCYTLSRYHLTILEILLICSSRQEEVNLTNIRTTPKSSQVRVSIPCWQVSNHTPQQKETFPRYLKKKDEELQNCRVCYFLGVAISNPISSIPNEIKKKRAASSKSDKSNTSWLQFLGYLLEFRSCAFKRRIRPKKDFSEAGRRCIVSTRGLNPHYCSSWEGSSKIYGTLDNFWIGKINHRLSGLPNGFYHRGQRYRRTRAILVHGTSIEKKADYRRLAANIMFGLLAFKYRRLPIKLRQMEALAFFDPSFFISFSFVTRGVATGLQPYIFQFLQKILSVLFCKMKIPSSSWLILI